MPKMIRRWLDQIREHSTHRFKTLPRHSLAVESLESRCLLALSWSSGPALPIGRADAAAALGSDGSILLVGGGTQTVLQLLPGDSVWTTAPNLDIPRVDPGASLLSDGRILTYGGWDGESLDAAFAYDYLTDNSQDVANMLNTREHPGFANVGGTAVAMGGIDRDGQILATVEAYDEGANQWLSLPDLPGPMYDFSAAYDWVHGQLYALGGATSLTATSVSNAVFRYDINLGTWSTSSPMPIAVRDSSAVFAPDGMLYIFGGYNGTSAVATVQAYDPLADTWSYDTDLPSAVRGSSAVVDLDGRILVIGGLDGSGVPVTEVAASQALSQALEAPTITSSPPLSVYATDSYVYEMTGTGNPLPAFSIVSAPAAMTIDSAGIVSWNPGLADIGSYVIILRASNSVGSVDQSFTLTVADPAPQITSSPVTQAANLVPYAYQLAASGYPAPTFSLVVGPAGMTVDPATGLVSWTPGVDQTGVHDVTLRAANVHGSADQSYQITVVDSVAPSVPVNLQVVALSTTTATLGWDASTDNVGVVGYRVYKATRCGWRGSRTCYTLVLNNLADPTGTVTGLVSGTTYTYVSTAFDAAGNESAKSAKLSLTTLKAPTLKFSNGLTTLAVNAVATHAVGPIGLYTTGVPTPTLSLVSGPAGLVLDSTAKTLTWTPDDTQVGTHTATVRATNSEGFADATVTFTVAANLPVISYTFTYFGLSYVTPFAVEGDPFTLQLADKFSNSTVTWSLVSGPAGMAVDATTGAVTWTPQVGDAGTTNVVFRGTNYVGSTDLNLSFTTYILGTDFRPPAAVSGIVVSNIDLYSATVCWSPSTDNVAVAGYEITAYYKYVSRGTHTKTYRFDSPGQTTSFDMTGLASSKNYTLYVRAYDDAGNYSPVGQTVLFKTTANPLYPNLVYSFPGYHGVADQPLTIQLSDLNIYPSTFSKLVGPAGMTVDAATGLVTWLPGYSDVGQVTAIFRATNAYGNRDVTLKFPVYFTGPVQAVGVSPLSSSSAAISWTPPADTSRVAGYFVTVSWTIGRTHGSRVYDVPGLGTSLDVFGLVQGPVLFKATVRAYDALGNLSVAGPWTSFTLP